MNAWRCCFGRGPRCALGPVVPYSEEHRALTIHMDAAALLTISLRLVGNAKISGSAGNGIVIVPLKLGIWPVR